MSNLLDLDYFRSDSKVVHTPIINVCIPQSAFQTHPEDQPDAICTKPPFTLLRVNDHWYLVTNELAGSGDISGLTPAYLYRGMRQDGMSFVLPVTLPGSNRPESLYEAWQDILAVSQKQLVKVRANTDAKRHEYEVVKSKLQWGWPNMNYQKWISMAFGDRIIRSADDPRLQKASKKDRSNQNDIEED